MTFVWGFQATPRPQCSEKYLESYTIQNNKKEKNPTIMPSFPKKIKTLRDLKIKGNLLAKKKAALFVCNWNVFAAISQKFLKHKNWQKKNNEKPSPINNAWHSWPAKEAKDAVHCQALTRHNWFQLFKGHFPIFIILTVNASSSTQLPSGIFWMSLTTTGFLS